MSDCVGPDRGKSKAVPQPVNQVGGNANTTAGAGAIALTAVLNDGVATGALTAVLKLNTLELAVTAADKTVPTATLDVNPEVRTGAATVVGKAGALTAVLKAGATELDVVLTAVLNGVLAGVRRQSIDRPARD
jgi:hypothetical protein